MQRAGAQQGFTGSWRSLFAVIAVSFLVHAPVGILYPNIKQGENNERFRKQTREDLTIYKIIYSRFSGVTEIACKGLKILVRPAGLEPATPCLEGRCSIRLSYGRKLKAKLKSKKAKV
jgi:hypothetical protein